MMAGTALVKRFLRSSPFFLSPLLRQERDDTQFCSNVVPGADKSARAVPKREQRTRLLVTIASHRRMLTYAGLVVLAVDAYK